MCQEFEHFYFFNNYQPFNQTILYLRDIRNTQSNNIIPTGHPQHTIKPHFHSASISTVIFHTAHRATGSSSLIVYSAIQNFCLALTEAGIIKHNTMHHNTLAGTYTATDKCTSTHTHTCAQAQTHTRAHTHTHTHIKGRERQIIVLLVKG